MVTKKIKHKDKNGNVIEVNIGAEAKNITEDTNRRFMTDAEKAKLENLNKDDVGLGEVDNTSDADKPVSAAQQEALDGKVTAAGGDIAATKVSAFTASSASYPVPAANDTVKVGFGKIKKFFEDIRNAATGACFIGQIVNNCVTNNAKLPLSAAQGKALMDLYTKLNSEKLAISVFNNHKSSGDHDGRYFTESEVNSKIKGAVGNMKYMPPEYLNNPPAFFNLTGYNCVFYVTLASVSFNRADKQWSLVLGVHDHNDGLIKGGQFAISTTKQYTRNFTMANGWSSTWA